MKLLQTESAISLAFSAYRQWGPIRNKPPLERIRVELPDATQEQVDGWLVEFKKIHQLMWEISQQGGSFKLGDEEVSRILTEAFPFLSGKGLKGAIYDLNWDAWHEGLDK
ncbi:MAG: hypothetical protein JST05_00610 [Acidobacteria bacterium]|nr:hypothetical protein [Acidobacteriota bacterium]